ncbi:MAG: CoA transferase, partial [Pseudomonadota bacterium]
MSETKQAGKRPLDGITVLEMGQLIAGPQAGCVLAYFGAEVIKVEPPGRGDPIRQWRLLDEQGTSYWWQSIARNKKSVTINLRADAGREVARQLIGKVDVVIENFRPGAMEKWGLGPDVFKTTNPDLVYTRVSGYGQSGPMSSHPGYASACEAYGGFRYLNGFADRPPVRPNLSLGDTLAAMHAVIGVLLALLARGTHDTGQVVDVSIFESVYNMMEAVVPEYSATGVIREPSGSTLTGIVPTNTYPCADDKYVVIGGNGDSIFQRLM